MDATVIGNYVFPRLFNPRLPSEYSPLAVLAYFQDGTHVSEFIAWRDYFFPGTTSCDRCCILLFNNCGAGPGGNPPCSHCQDDSENCQFLTDNNPAPNNDNNSATNNGPQQAAHDTPVPPRPSGPSLFADLVDQQIDRFLNDSNFAPDANAPDANIAPDPSLPQFDIPLPDVDDLFPDLAPGSVNMPTQPPPGNQPPQNPTQAVLPPFPNIQNLYVTGRRRKRCHLCSTFDPHSNAQKKCDWHIDTATGLQQACTRCSAWGLVCLVDDTLLPPRPNTRITIIQGHKCTPCSRAHTSCDRQIPCDGCRNDAGACQRINRVPGLFTRGAGIATECYPYLASVGGGILGSNDQLNQFTQVYDLQPDFHIQFYSWVSATGQFPMPPGYPQPLRFPGRPQFQVQLRTLPLPLPPQQAVPQPPQPAQQPAPRGGAWSRPIIIPPGDEFRSAGARNVIIFNVSSYLQGPVPDNPLTTAYRLPANPNLAPFLQLGLDDPERADANLLVLPPPRHPNPIATPVLRSIPEFSRFDVDPFAVRPCIGKIDGVPCGQPTGNICEDLYHLEHHPVAVCDTCNRDDSAMTEQGLRLFAHELRGYACAGCAVLATNPAVYANQRMNVWGLPPDSLDPANLVQNQTPSVDRGAPRRMTGCACATNLLDRTICYGHRFEHFLEVRFRVLCMRAYIMANMGRMVCPVCLTRTGADAYNFTGGPGIADQQQQNQHVMYVCLACFGIVVTDPAGLAAIDA
ncbi:hypothetical protein F4777DRAFT_108577 [Nemania sp. FL0916]|nr:hypothetical protein F4777DRAFT_108577 [Nemania sp. FL0916]